MSSGGKSGGSNMVNEYHGTIAGALGEGPAWSLEWIIMGGRTVWSGGLMKPEGADFSNIDLAGVGSARFHWGTETQMPDPDLNAYAEEPAFRGWVYIVLIDCAFGANSETNAPTIEVGWRRLPNQLIVSGSPAANDGAATANPVAVGAEILTSPSWGGLPADRINAESFQAVAEELQAESVPDTNRVQTSIAPLWNEQTELKAALADIYSVAKVWLRIGVDGRIEAGRWKRDVNTAGVTHLTAHDVDSERSQTDRSDDLPNSFAVEFRDASKHHKANVVTVDNTAAIRRPGGTLRRQTAKRSLLIWQDQAVAHGADLLRESSVPKTTLTLAVRRSKAVNPDGTAIRPGDYFTYNVEEQGSAADTRLFRCVRRQFEPAGLLITLVGEMETVGAVQAVPFDPGVTVVPQATPPINWARVLAIAPLVTDDRPCVAVLAARPSDMAFGFDVRYCASQTGDFASLGTSTAFAMPMKLAASLSAAGSMVRVALLSGLNGESAQRDKTMFLNWNGGIGEAGLDALLLCIIAKDGGGHVTGYEFVSVSGPASAVAMDTYDVPVLRGRRGTVARDFTTGSFPDAWTNYEVWCVPQNGPETFEHPDLESAITTRATAYFELIPYGQSGTYDPAIAWTERQRRAGDAEALGEFAAQPDGVTVVPQITYVMPAERIPPVYSSAKGFVSFAFKRAKDKPDTPTGGSYSSPVPAGWSAGAPLGTDPLWMSQRRFTLTGIGQDDAWSAPVRMEGVNGGFVDYVFKRAATLPATPTGNGTPAGWSDGPPTGTDPLWMSSGFKTAADVIVGAWSTPVRLDAPNLQTQYSVTGTSGWHTPFASGDLYMRTSADGGVTWTGAMRIIGEQGAQGIPGPGLVYVGDFVAGAVYYCTASRVDVVSYGGSYYRATATAKSGTNTWGVPGGADWSAPDATFKFVATDLLLARDATILKTLVMGDGTSGAGVIRSGTATAFGTGAGFWLGYDGTTAKARFGDPAGNRLAWDGSSLKVYANYFEIGGSTAKFIVDIDPDFVGPFPPARMRFGSASITSDGTYAVAKFGSCTLDNGDNSVGINLSLSAGRMFGRAGGMVFKNSYWSGISLSGPVGAASIYAIDTGSAGGDLVLATTPNGSGSSGVPLERVRIRQNGRVDLSDENGNSFCFRINGTAFQVYTSGAWRDLTTW